MQCLIQISQMFLQQKSVMSFFQNDVSVTDVSVMPLFSISINISCVSVSDIIPCSRHGYVISLFEISYYISLKLLNVKWYHCFRHYVIFLFFKYIIMSLFQMSHHFPILVNMLCLTIRYHITSLFQIIYHVFCFRFLTVTYCVCCRYHISSLFKDYINSPFQIFLISYYVSVSDIISCLWRVRPLWSRVLVGDWDPPLLYHWPRLGVQL